MSTPEQSTPEQMRAAVARYVEEIHRAYVAQALTFPAAVRGRMPLLAGGPLTVAAVGARNLHVLATRDSLGPVRAPEVELSAARWRGFPGRCGSSTRSCCPSSR